MDEKSLFDVYRRTRGIDESKARKVHGRQDQIGLVDNSAEVSIIIHKLSTVKCRLNVPVLQYPPASRL